MFIEWYPHSNNIYNTVRYAYKQCYVTTPWTPTSGRVLCTVLGTNTWAGRSSLIEYHSIDNKCGQVDFVKLLNHTNMSKFLSFLASLYLTFFFVPIRNII